ncbi:MAG: hypothetical protein LBB18_04260 [Puniceicoccales bacterium]|jgi:DNA polymerase III epsilon subunit-like protein|nr:hypothetical protein [Puniceicoccales bacterium]
MDTIHVLDFEGNRRLGISEFGVVTMRGFAIDSTRSEFCVRNFCGHAEYFLSLRRSGLLAAHSAQTEDHLLRHYWASPGQVPVFIESRQTLCWGPWIDTKLIYRRLFGGLKSYELNDLIDAFDLRANLALIAKKHCSTAAIGFHNALFDALAAALLIQNLRQHFSNVSLQTLISLCEQ